MKQIKYYIIGILTLACALLLYSCDESYPDANDSPYEIDLIEAYMIDDNGVRHKGEINDSAKLVTFDVFPRKADYSKFKMEVKTSEGTTADIAKLDFSMANDEYQKVRVLDIVSDKSNRYKTYFVQVDKKTPPIGVNFDAVKKYEYSAAAGNIYPDMRGHDTRCADMDNEHVLIVSRGAINHIHLLAIEELKNGITTPILLKGRPFGCWSGGIAHGHIYGINLPNPSGGGVIQLLHWENATAETPDKKEITAAELKEIGYNAAGRFGDYMSVSINERGSGSIFLGVNGSQTDYKILQLKIKNFKEVTDMKFLNPATYGGFWATFNQVDGSPSEYIYTGHQGPVMLTDGNGKITYSMSEENLPKEATADTHIITFNNARYLITTTAVGSPSLRVYDITRGETIKEALEILDSSSPFRARFTYNLGGEMTSSYAAGMTAWSVSEDGEKLYIMTGGPLVGFALLEFPKVIDDEGGEEE